MGKYEDAPTLINGHRAVRLVEGRQGVIAQLFEGHPQLGGRYLGKSVYETKTLDEVIAVYAGRGWTRTGRPGAAA